jgi:DNA-binding transcriptional regulator GbsR (MarR family)
MDENGGPDAGEDPVAAAQARVVEAFGRAAEVYGINRSYGRLYGILYFADGELSLDELVEESGYAKSTVSSAMTSLERLHLVRRSSRPGEGRKAFFEAERDFWYVFKQLLDREGRRELSVMNRAIEDAEERLAEAPDSERAERTRQRVEDLRGIYDQFERLVGLFSRLPVDRLVDRLSDRG